MTSIYINADDFARLQETLERFPTNAEQAINEVIHSESGIEPFERNIRNLMPVSGRRFKGHSTSAKAGWIPSTDKENLAVSILGRGKWRYLYFPDDGSNTKRHAGMQQFFPRGIEAGVPDVLDKCIENIIRKFEEE